MILYCQLYTSIYLILKKNTNFCDDLHPLMHQISYGMLKGPLSQ